MAHNTISATCDRIETAIARIARAADAAQAGGDRDLRRRHVVLRNAATESLAVIDALIAASQPDGHQPESGD